MGEAVPEGLSTPETFASLESHQLSPHMVSSPMPCWQPLCAIPSPQAPPAPRMCLQPALPVQSAGTDTLGDVPVFSLCAALALQPPLVFHGPASHAVHSNGKPCYSGLLGCQALPRAQSTDVVKASWLQSLHGFSSWLAPISSSRPHCLHQCHRQVTRAAWAGHAEGLLCPGVLARACREGVGWEKGNREQVQTPKAPGHLPRNGSLNTV